MSNSSFATSIVMSHMCLFLFTVLGTTVTGIPRPTYALPFNVEELTSIRIVGGEPAPDGFAPHMVALVLGDIVTMLLCGASIVSKGYLLTAAHCIDAALTWNGELMPSLRGIAGSNKHTSTEIVIRFSDYKKHPKYDMHFIKNDVGLLFTSEEIKLNHRVAIIPLKHSFVDEGVKCIATGWGRNENFLVPEDLQLLHVTTMSGQGCIDAMSQWRAPYVDPAIEICTLHSLNHGGMCHGDSGSAIFSEDTWEQVGIVSWGIPCAWGAPDVAVRISGVWDFIESVLASSTD